MATLAFAVFVGSAVATNLAKRRVRRGTYVATHLRVPRLDH